MLVIRLQRTGRRNLPTYRVVLAEKARAVKGKSLEVLGFYLPQRDPVVLEIKEDRVMHWVGKGAIPSDTIARIFKRKGMKGMEKFIQRYTKQRPKGEEPAAPAAQAKPETPSPEAPPAAAPEGDKPKE